jgi:hypothetical protein
MMISLGYNAKSSTPSTPWLIGMEGYKPATARGFHTFHTFHTIPHTYMHRRTHTRAHACVHISNFGMEGLEGMEQQGNTRLSGFHTSIIRFGRCGT